MGLKDDINGDINGILSQPWDMRDGIVVPEDKDVALAGGAVKLSATMLYADLADSTLLSSTFDRRVAAKVIKLFLAACSRVIRDQGGYIRSFDGDRVMAVFLGNYKNTSATKVALMINWVVLNMVKPRIETTYTALKQGGYVLTHCVGIDVSEVLVVRAGIRNNNDLVWIGRAPNIAAKLANVRQAPHNSFVTKSVFDVLHDEAKYGGNPRRLMWESCTWNPPPSPGVDTVYRSEWGMSL